ncbi:MAG: hypothetical protein ACM3PY_02060 [Omnitrophica WOR_2 bacterium]
MDGANHLPATPGWLRLSGLALGIILFVWLPFEDITERWVILFSLAISTWAAVRLSILYRVRARYFLPLQVLTGALAGLAVSLLALLLMAFKSGIHGHAVADFTPQQVVDVLGRTPFWGSAGFLFGLGSALWRLVRTMP